MTDSEARRTPATIRAEGAAEQLIVDGEPRGTEARVRAPAEIALVVRAPAGHGGTALGRVPPGWSGPLDVRVRLGELARHLADPAAGAGGGRLSPIRYIVHASAAGRREAPDSVHRSRRGAGATPPAPARYIVHNPQAQPPPFGTSFTIHRARRLDSVHHSPRLGTSFTLRFGTSFTETRYIIHNFADNPLFQKADSRP